MPEPGRLPRPLRRDRVAAGPVATVVFTGRTRLSFGASGPPRIESVASARSASYRP